MATKTTRYTLPPDVHPLPETPIERFCRTLRHAINKAGFVYLTDFCRAVETELGSEFGRQTLNSYLRGGNWPQLPRLIAMAKVLKVSPNYLVPQEDWGHIEPPVAGRLPRSKELRSVAPALDQGESSFTMTAQGGKFLVSFTGEVDLDTALKLAALVNPT